MKKFTILILLVSFGSFVFSQISNQKPILKITSETEEEIIMEFNLNSYYFEQVETSRGLANVTKIPGCSNNYTKGTPDLAYYTKAINIPAKGNVHCEVLNYNYIVIPDILIAPSRGSIMRNIDPQTVPYGYGKEYSINAFMPDKQAFLSEPYIIHKLRGTNLTIVPFSYNPVTRELRIYTDILLKLTFDSNSSSKNELTVSNNKVADEFLNLYKRHFVNFHNNSKYTPLEDGTPGKMLIICADNYASAMYPYISWKREKGIEVEMVLKSQVGTTSTQIKSFIQNYYNNNELTYVLLVGDGPDIPPMTISNNDSDNGYAYLNGSDGYADVFIGRFSGNSVADIQIQVQKMIYYERDMGVDAAWLENAFGSASSEGGGSTGHNGGESDVVHLNLIKTKLENYGYTVTHVNQDGGNNAMITTAFNSGMGVANYIGHGDVTLWVNTNFTNTNVNALTNNYKLPFIFSVACVNGDFKNNTCFAETWLRASNNGQPTGAVGFLGSTINQSWNEPMTGQDEMNDILVESYQNNIKRTYGGICFNGLFKMIEEGGQGQAMADTWTLFGDPSLMVRTKTPQVMNITHSGTVSVGATEFIVNCDVEGALVSLTKYENNETIIIGYAYVSGGIANVTIAPFDAPGTMKVTVTAFNKITYQEDVTVIVPEGPYIVNGGFSINDEDSNNNGVVDYNETFFINQALNNVGIADASFVTATISSTSSDVQILQESAIFGFISAGCTSTLGNAYMVSVNDGVADQTLIPFSLLVEDMENHTWIMNYNIAVNAPAMEISFYGIDDSQGNNNGMLNAGEQVILKIKVANNGHSASQAGNLHIYSSNANVALLDSEKPVIGINYGEFEIIEFELVVNEETPVGENICFDYVLNTGMYNAQSSTCLPCGLQIEDFETGDFTKYEWVNNTNRPWIIVSDVVYEGQNAAKSGQVPSSGGESVLTINLNVLNNDEIQFYKKVSCEAASSWWGQLTYWDYLSFSIDNVEKGKWAGEVNWSQETYPVTAGNHSFKWTYKKDNYVDEGSDCAWLDYIKLPNHQQAVSIVNSNVVVSQNIVNVYPNPATNHFNVYVNLTENIEAKIYVYTIDGKTVYEYSQSFEILKGENIIPINSSKFDNGIYIVKLVLENEIYTKSVIINR